MSLGAFLNNASFDYKNYVIAFSFIVFVWENYLCFRQHMCLIKGKIPKKLKEHVSDEKFEKTREYGLDKSVYGFVHRVWDQITSTLFIVYDVLPFFWNLSGQVMQQVFEYGPEFEITQSLIFVGMFSFVNLILSTPFSLYYTFVLEEKHGFNKQTFGTWISDTLKTMVLGVVIGAPFLSLFLYIVKTAGDNFYFYVWIFLIIFQFTVITLYPTLIAPLFNKYTPLADGELRTRLNFLAEEIKFPLTKIFVIDGSRRSSHSNAYLYGFFKNKRIVLYDTLLEKASIQEVCSILSHELGHWAMSHVSTTLIISEIQLLIVFYLFSHFIHLQPLYDAFGFAGTQPTLIGFLLFQYIYAPFDALTGFMMNLNSRRHEFQADEFAVKLGYGEELKSGLIKIHLGNLGNLTPDRLYSIWTYSHPPLVERLDAADYHMDAFAKKDGAKKGKTTKEIVDAKFAAWESANGKKKVSEDVSSGNESDASAGSGSGRTLRKRK